MTETSLNAPISTGPTVDAGPLSDAGRARMVELADQAGVRRIHMLGWRDLDDDEAGGSEVHASTVAALWAQAGLEITMRSSASVGRSAVGFRDGYRVVRRGSRYGVFPRAAAAEITGRHGPCDALVEIWNGMPFASPLWWRGPHAVWLHHVHGPMWNMALGDTLGRVGRLLEERLAPPLYRRVPVVTLSQSSEAELIDELGFDRARVGVVEPGIDARYSPGGSRSDSPLVVAVGRLAPVKRFPMLIRAAARARERIGDLQLVIVGEGYTRPDVVATIDEVGGHDWVRLAGHVSDDELIGLYRSAWCVASASEREGWGMTLTEAAACGTPAVVTNIAGHSDATRDELSGLLCDGEKGLTDGLVRLLGDATLRARLQAGALARAAELTWEHTAIANLEVLCTGSVSSARPTGGA
ncbi:glycosyltransferase family 4 protein [Candidatus Microthrix sp.]|uniref:glycosyltransferase family 4 protein n=1 Tax=Candidatus Neomicrothrix sp. TaxID=2719034 RepID=UPI001B630703|nr:glycosyltransferase family 4 protein [Candidatus Microthrix sp.]MBP7405474.1 glycosyltransferase family 4 protein [Candidatus Microthrix sp.]MBP7851219.1 glycosyltransferase family 4 protein [Candidatus Microthrix sp.]MBP7878219.1 glycosyltransferase family 4 protein [Candidatus Microthrix sp.]MBP8956206.1 glycosyltransferase family 4 protein [Candidatus Microthrix sp.]MBP9835226.1 glycosyltransferase family 4 protein [Candidatus Microthrix sp.]